jgi:hypothetical protein
MYAQNSQLLSRIVVLEPHAIKQSDGSNFSMGLDKHLLNLGDSSLNGFPKVPGLPDNWQLIS